jgi:hypothetical protein
MADISILATQTAAAPTDYVVKGAQEIVVRAVTASFDGTAAGGSFVPAVQVIDTGGTIVGTYPCSTTLAAGALADVSWFPGLAAAGAGGGGGSSSDWALIGTGLTTNLGTGATVLSVSKLNTNNPAIFKAVLPALNTSFTDVDDITNSDRWNAEVFQIRNGAVDASSSSAWTASTAGPNPITGSVTVSAAGEFVLAFLDKQYIRGITAVAPYTLLYSDQVPSCVSCGQYFALTASGQGPGAVGWSGTLAAGDLLDNEPWQLIMVGVKPAGGSPTQVSLTRTTQNTNKTITPSMPAAVQANDILIMQLGVRAANNIRNIPTPAGWTLLAQSVDRTTDPSAGQVDQMVYASAAAVNAYVLEIDTAGVYELHSGMIGDDAVASGAVEMTLAASAGGTLASWDGGNYIGSGVSDGTLTHWRPNQSKILAVDTPPVRVSLTANNRTANTIGVWEAGIFARKLSDPITTSGWDI